MVAQCQRPRHRSGRRYVRGTAGPRARRKASIRRRQRHRARPGRDATFGRERRRHRRDARARRDGRARGHRHRSQARGAHGLHAVGLRAAEGDAATGRPGGAGRAHLDHHRVRNQRRRRRLSRPVEQTRRRAWAKLFGPVRSRATRQHRSDADRVDPARPAWRDDLTAGGHVYRLRHAIDGRGRAATNASHVAIDWRDARADRRARAGRGFGAGSTGHRGRRAAGPWVYVDPDELLQQRVFGRSGGGMAGTGRGGRGDVDLGGRGQPLAGMAGVENQPA